MVLYAQSMHVRPARVIAGVMAWIALGAAAFFLFNSQRQLATRKTALRAYDLHVREAIDATNELRTAQQAYVAMGQGVAFWVAKVATTGDTIRASIRSLRGAAEADTAKHALDAAARSLEQFTEIDKRALDYINAAQTLMAADVIFTEGSLAAADAARSMEQARLADLQQADAVEANVHRRQAQVAAAGVGCAAAIILLLIPVNARRASTSDDSASSATETAAVHENETLEYARALPAVPRSVDAVQPMHTSDPADEMRRVPRNSEPDDSLRLTLAIHESDDLRITLDNAATDGGSLGPLPQQVPAGFFKAAAELATDFGRVRDMTDLHTLVARTAELIDASGMVLWMGAPNGGELRPLLTHGYTPHMVARLAPVSRSASNAAAAAFRSGRLQIVQSEPGSSGAIVAPILAADGCIGALAAELSGGEASERVQAITAIVSAHLAAVLTSGEEQASRRAAG